MPLVISNYVEPWAALLRFGHSRTTLASVTVLLTVVGCGSASVHATQPQSAVAQAPLKFTGYVVDQAQVLNVKEKQDLNKRLQRFQWESGHQIAVVTVKSLGGEDIVTFTKRLSNRWGVGRRGINDGIMVLVAPHERTARISIGYGLERQLPDAFCRQVMDGMMVPAFAQGKIGRGINAGISAIIKRLSTPAANVR